MATALTGLAWFPSRGLNTVSPPHMVPLDMCADGFDFDLEDLTILKKRGGYEKTNATAVSANPTINSMGSLYLSNGTKQEFVGTNFGDIWQDSGVAITTKILTGLSTTTPSNFTQLLDTLIVLDGVSAAYTWDGTTSGTITAAATGAKYAEAHVNKLFITGIGDAPSTVGYSATGNINVYTGAGTGQFNVEQNNGQILTGIKSFAKNELLLFKERSTFKLIGFDKPSFNLVPIDKSIGCISNDSIQNFKSGAQGGLCIWAARDGIYIYDGSAPKKISSYIQSYWNGLNFNRGSFFKSTINSNTGKYLLAVSTGSNIINDQIIVIDLFHPWQDKKGLHFPIMRWRVEAQSLNTQVSTANAITVVFGGTNNGFKYRFGSAIRSDAGSSIESYVISPSMAFQDGVGTEQCLRRLFLIVSQARGSLDVSTAINDSQEWALQETVTTDQGGQIGVDFAIGISPIGLAESSFTAKVNTAVRSRRAKVRILQDSATDNFALQAPIELYAKAGGQRA